ncbi:MULTISPECIES: mannitol-1-phosphate 5-dehydrogenase [unclassified Oceanobacillus]|uniref:mannitol-1-phosphate 5-dehydrogenase n=1 Tax=unclassified Oceanobacillus TaxID=2630292 RepID=UPI00300E2A35
MEAVHFGAGNIGRGFIGLLLHQAGYHTTFIDVNEAVIKEINEKKQYTVVLAAEESESLTVKNIFGINSIQDPGKVIQAIVHADMITTAVGPNVLPIIAELIAKGLKERAKTTNQPLNIIACENMVGGTSFLKEKVYEHLTQEEKTTFDNLFGFPDAAVDRIVPNQKHDNLLQVSVEPYYEWVVEEPAIKGTKPDVNGITFVDDLTPYIERKLFTVNSGHAAVAYVGHQMGYQTITEAINDEKVQEIIKGALHESGEALIRTYDFNREEHQAYIEKIIGRFMNPYISDEITRVARGPIRKLGAKERLIRPASMYMDVTGKEPTYLAKTIVAALKFTNEQDNEAVKLQKIIADQGAQEALKEVSGLEAGHPLLKVILNAYNEIGD